MTDKPICRVCGVELGDGNWYKSSKKGGSRICKKCDCNRKRLWERANPEKARAQARLWLEANPEKVKLRRIRQGHRPFNENKECASYLCVHIAERVLSHVFKDVKRMPYGNRGYDIICNKEKLIDIKSSCIRTIHNNWSFSIRRNTIADYFLCLAFDKLKDLNPLHGWLLPGKKFNHLSTASICPSTIYKWDSYKLDINKVVACCNGF